MKHLFPILIVLLLGSTSFVGVSYTADNSSPISSDGITLYVGGDGPGNYSKIQDAIDNASDGDTVFVYNGTYFENIRVEKSINLLGECRETTVIDGGGLDKVVVIYGDNVKITGFTIRNSTYGGISLYHSNGNIIENNIIHSNINGIIFDSTSSNFNVVIDNLIINNDNGISLLTTGFSTNNIIKGNIIQGSQTYGIEVGAGCNKTSILYNNFIDNDWGGILIFSSHGTITNNFFLNNTIGINLFSKNGIISDNTFINDGISLSGRPYNNAVINNTVNGKPLVYLEGESNKVIDYQAGQVLLISCKNICIKNQEISNVYEGISLINSDYCVIQENNIKATHWGGVYLFSSLGNKILNNTFGDNSFMGIEISYSVDNQITNNSFLRNNISIDLMDSYGNEISYNNFEQNNMNAYFSSSFNYWNRNYWGKSRIFPYPIFGFISVFNHRIPWFQFDWFPAKEPYDSGV